MACISSSITSIHFFYVKTSLKLSGHYLQRNKIELYISWLEWHLTNLLDFSSFFVLLIRILMVMILMLTCFFYWIHGIYIYQNLWLVYLYYWTFYKYYWYFHFIFKDHINIDPFDFFLILISLATFLSSSNITSLLIITFFVMRLKNLYSILLSLYPIKMHFSLLSLSLVLLAFRIFA